MAIYTQKCVFVCIFRVVLAKTTARSTGLTFLSVFANLRVKQGHLLCQFLFFNDLHAQRIPNMKHQHISAVIAILLSLMMPSSQAQNCTSQTFGGTTFHNCGSTSGTSQRFGNTTFHNFGGTSGTSQRFGGTTFHNFGGTSGTSQEFSGTTFHNFGGTSGASQKFGGTTFTNCR